MFPGQGSDHRVTSNLEVFQFGLTRGCGQFRLDIAEFVADSRPDFVDVDDLILQFHLNDRDPGARGSLRAA